MFAVWGESWNIYLDFTLTYLLSMQLIKKNLVSIIILLYNLILQNTNHDGIRTHTWNAGSQHLHSC